MTDGDKENSRLYNFLIYFLLAHPVIIFGFLKTDMTILYDWILRSAFPGIILALYIDVDQFFTIILIILLAISIWWFEDVAQIFMWNKRIRSCIIFTLVLKELIICILMTYISLLVVTSVILIVLNDDTLTKTLFNFIVCFTFLTALFIYSIYMKKGIPLKREEKITKFKKGKETQNPILENKHYSNRVIEISDFITIFVTVLLLGNATFTTLELNEIKLESNFYDSFEFTFLFIWVAIYVQSAYHKLFKI